MNQELSDAERLKIWRSQITWGTRVKCGSAFGRKDLLGRPGTIIKVAGTSEEDYVKAGRPNFYKDSHTGLTVLWDFVPGHPIWGGEFEVYESDRTTWDHVTADQLDPE